MNLLKLTAFTYLSNQLEKVMVEKTSFNQLRRIQYLEMNLTGNVYNTGKL